MGVNFRVLINEFVLLYQKTHRGRRDSILGTGEQLLAFGVECDVAIDRAVAPELVDGLAVDSP
ncbi:hypothetical protein [Frankia sp. Cppng1_Ct_nod]|uniref:hypothetical protein n=1 Tax=Frankia sp. Cppng1_Ct_nod TaxID=2897162 RepID=UPI001040FD4F|nr:hypothetical protein [Frankia sp. Cppng1_Ct_nod]